MSLTKPAGAARNTVLVVDDDDDMVEAMQVILERSGYPVLIARNGAEALGWLVAGSSSVCLILLDLMMPVMDGWKFRQAQLQDPAMADVPVVVLSGRVDVMKDGASVQAADYLRKPIELEELLDIVRRYCGTGRRAEPIPLRTPGPPNGGQTREAGRR